MSFKPHSKRWYAQLAEQSGEYIYPWRQTLVAPSGEALFDGLLDTLLTPESTVLEAGCGHGRDARRVAPGVRSYTGYDFTPGFLERARRDVPQGDFLLWDSSREPLPTTLEGRFDLVFSRRGPTSLIPHLRRLCRPGADVLCLHPGAETAVAKVTARLEHAGLTPAAQWHIRVTGFLPTLADFVSYQRFHGDDSEANALVARWQAHAEAEGYPFEEQRYIYLVKLP